MRAVLLLLLLAPSCAPKPSEPVGLPSYAYVEMRSDSLVVTARNPLPVVGTMALRGSDGSLVRSAVLAPGDSVQLGAIALAGRDSASVVDGLTVSGIVGDAASRPDPSARYAFPFPRGRSYRVMQAYEGSFSHDSDFSRYAVDFTLAVGDTVAAARDGIVATLVDRHTRGGNDPDLRLFGNYVTLYHADGMMTQYVHLAPDGALVSVGDSVRAADPIGISGRTGFTSKPHLHFNVLQPVEGGAVSIPVRFEQVDGRELRKGDRVTH